MNGKKMVGQIWSIDLAVSAVVFLGVVVFIFFIWNNVSLESQEQSAYRDVETRALILSDSLIRTPGVPADWTGTTVKVIGLAETCGVFCENVLSPGKVQEFVSGISYNTARGLLGLRNSEFYFALRDLNGTLLAPWGTPLEKGAAPSPNATVVVPTERFALLDGNMTRVVLTVWSP